MLLIDSLGQQIKFLFKLQSPEQELVCTCPGYQGYKQSKIECRMNSVVTFLCTFQWSVLNNLSHLLPTMPYTECPIRQCRLCTGFGWQGEYYLLDVHYTRINTIHGLSRPNCSSESHNWLTELFPLFFHNPDSSIYSRKQQRNNLSRRVPI